MKKFTILPAIVITILFSNLIFGQSNDIAPKTSKLWETEKVFQTPESVYYDSDNDVLYVANINGSPVVKDDNGFITKMTPNGKVIELKWIDGLNAPKGMCKYGEILFITDIDEIIEIDISSGKILKKHSIEGAGFLNDIAVDTEGNVYISDTRKSVIYRLKNNNVEEWFSNEEFTQANGLFFGNNVLYAGFNNAIVKINPRTGEFKLVAEGMGTIDGLNMDENWNFIVSNFTGKVQYIMPNNKFVELFDTSDQLINAADIFYNPKTKTLYVPTFVDKRVMAYTLEYQ